MASQFQREPYVAVVETGFFYSADAVNSVTQSVTEGILMHW